MDFSTLLKLDNQVVYVKRSKFRGNYKAQNRVDEIELSKSRSRNQEFEFGSSKKLGTKLTFIQCTELNLLQLISNMNSKINLHTDSLAMKK